MDRMGVMPTLNLLVLRCRNIEVSKAFYSGIGLAFSAEKLGSGPMHYAAELDHVVLEIYPLRENEIPDSSRLGFCCGSFTEISEAVRITATQPPLERDGKLIIVVQDPDGRKVEICQGIR